MTCAANCKFGENDAALATGFGPWTEHVSLREEVDGINVLGAEDSGASSSKYAEPEAAGTSPVLRTGIRVRKESFHYL